MVKKHVNRKCAVQRARVGAAQLTLLLLLLWLSSPDAPVADASTDDDGDGGPMGSSGGGGEEGAESLPGDLARRLVELFSSVKALGGELRAAGDEWLGERAAALEAAAGRLRRAVRPASQRLQQALQRECSQPVFVPPADVPATIVGPGLSYMRTSGSCQVRRIAVAVQRDIVLRCTDPGVVLTRTVARYTSAYQAPARFTATECKSIYRFGPAASVTVALWAPGERPRDVVLGWRQRLAGWQQLWAEATEAGGDGGGAGAGGGGGEGGTEGNGGGGSSGGDMAMLAQMSSLPAEALRSALSRHGDAIRKALDAWAADGDPSDAGAAAAGGGGGTGVSLLATAAGLLLQDLGMYDAARHLSAQLLQSPPAQPQTTTTASMTWQQQQTQEGTGAGKGVRGSGRGSPGGESPHGGGGAGGGEQIGPPVGNGDNGPPRESVLLGETWKAVLAAAAADSAHGSPGGNVSGVFEAVREAGLAAMRLEVEGVARRARVTVGTQPGAAMGGNGDGGSRGGGGGGSGSGAGGTHSEGAQAVFRASVRSGGGNGGGSESGGSSLQRRRSRTQRSGSGGSDQSSRQVDRGGGGGGVLADLAAELQRLLQL